MIEIDHISKSYDGGKTLSVNDISLQIREGEIFGLLGPNGAGKSTLLNMIAGILLPTKGRILLNNIDVNKDPITAKLNLSYMSDSPDHLLRLKGHEFLRFIADIYQVPQDVRTQRIDQLTREYGMEKELENQIQSYSHGMRQKMMVIGALLPNPDIWVLDEPMTGLDPRAAWNLKQSMRQHADSGKTVLFSTHVLDVAEKVVDRVGIISKGKIIFVGTVSQMREHFNQNGSLEEMFLELTSEDSSPLPDAMSQGEPQFASPASAAPPANTASYNEVR